MYKIINNVCRYLNSRDNSLKEYETKVNTYKYKDDLINVTEWNNKQSIIEIVYSNYFLDK